MPSCTAITGGSKHGSTWKCATVHATQLLEKDFSPYQTQAEGKIYDFFFPASLAALQSAILNWKLDLNADFWEKCFLPQMTLAYPSLGYAPTKTHYHLHADLVSD